MLSPPHGAGPTARYIVQTFQGAADVRILIADASSRSTSQMYRGAVLGKLAVIVLILFVLLLAFPLGMGMAMEHCPECTIGPGNPLLAYEVALASLLVAGAGMTRCRAPKGRVLGLLLTRRLDRPPRFS